MSTHSKEPWRYDKERVAIISPQRPQWLPPLDEGDEEQDSVVIDCRGACGGSEADIPRIVSCVNKLAGHADLDAVAVVPVGELEALRECARHLRNIVDAGDFQIADSIVSSAALAKLPKP